MDSRFALLFDRVRRVVADLPVDVLEDVARAVEKTQPRNWHALTASVTSVTFAVYKIPLIGQAIVRAAKRGATARLVIESPESSEGKIAYDGIAALGPEVAARSTVFIWPHDKRPVTPAGHHGSLHVKCAVADENELFLMVKREDIILGVTKMLENLERLIRECRVVSLAQPMYQGMPCFPAHVPYCFTLNKRHLDDPYPNGIGSANDAIFATTHSGTHIDAIGHFARDGKLHQGYDVLSNQKGKQGMLVHGIENTPPILRHAVLLDAAACNDVDALDPAKGLTALDLKQTARMERVDIRPGDVVFVRTGWGQFWNDPPRFLGVGRGTPGPDLDGAGWLIEKGASLVGSDTAAFELAPGQGVVHGLLLVDHGVQIVENLNLEELARERIYSFMLFMSPLKIMGGTASPVTPVALCR